MPKKGAKHVFHLIKLLSKNEKRYFKLFCSLYTPEKDNNYIVLFNAMDKQQAYDEQALKKKFHDRPFIKRLDLVKSRLFNTILKSLELYYSDSTLDIYLKRQLIFVELLFQKGMFEASEKILSNLKKTATLHENHIALIEIADWTHKIDQAKYPFRMDSRHIQTFDEEIKLVGELSTIYQYRKLTLCLIQLLKEKNIKEINKLIKHPLLINDSRANSFLAKLYYHGFYVSYHAFFENYNQLYLSSKRRVGLFKKNSVFIKKNAWSYFMSLNNLAKAAIVIGKYKDVLPNIKKMRMICGKMPDHKSEYVRINLLNTLFLEIQLYTYSAQFEKAMLLIPSIEKEINLLEEKTTTERRVLFQFAISVVYLAKSKFKESLNYINKIIHHSELLGNYSVTKSAFFLNIIIHFELGNMESVTSFIGTAKRFMVKHNSFGAHEKIILDFLQKLSVVSVEESLPIFKEFKTALEKRMNKKQPSPIDDFNINLWIESKIEGTSYEDLAKRKKHTPVKRN